jgi:hypothetical protein
VTARFSEAADRLSLASAPTPNVGFTFACWARLTTDANQQGTILRLFDTVTTLTFGVGSDGTTLGCVSVGNTGGVNVGTLTVGTWYRVALTVSGTSGTVYLAEGQNGSITSVTGTVSGGSAVPTGLALGGRSPADSSEPWPGDLAYPRVWNRVLGQSALGDQWKLAAPTDTPVWSDWPLTSDLLDDSGNARHLLAGATPVEFLSGDEPPLGGNTSPSITTLAVSAVGANVTATITATDAQDLIGATYAVDWGDGGISSGSGTTYPHTYTSTGTYAVLASVTDSGDLSGYKAAALSVIVSGVAPPDGALVADAWLRLVSGLPASCVGPTLPNARRTPSPAWVTSGFVQHTVVGGSPNVHVPLRRSVVQVDCWAVTLDDRTPPWGRASALAEAVLGAAYGTVNERTLAVPVGYGVPLLRTVTPLQEPRKVREDGAGFARFQLDLEFVWTS